MKNCRNFGDFCQYKKQKKNQIKTARELCGELLRGIPIVLVKDNGGYVPFAELVDIADVVSAAGEPGHRHIKLKIRRKEDAGAGGD